MDRLHYIKTLFRPATVALALGIPLIGMSGLYAFVVKPSQRAKSTAQANLRQITETYVQLKSQDLSLLEEYLQHEVDYLQSRRKKVFARKYALQDIPVLVSEIEQLAEKSGLKTSVDIREQEKTQPLKTVSLNVSFTGRFAGICDFLAELKDMQKIHLVQTFRLSSHNAKQAELEGAMQFLILMRS